MEMSTTIVARSSGPCKPPPQSRLSAADYARAWRTSYRIRLDDLPDQEIAWEARLWHWLGVETIAAIGDDLLRQRTASGLVIPSETTAHDLDRLWRSVDQRCVIAMVRQSATPLVTAMRL
jgi:hypothetical protein